MLVRVVVSTLGLVVATALTVPAPPSVPTTAAAAGLEISRAETEARVHIRIARAKTEALIRTSASGAETIQLTFGADLVSEDGFDVSDDVVVTWQEVGGIEPTPFRILIPVGCFMDRRGRGFYVDDFRTCGVELSVGSSARGLVLLQLEDFQTRLVHRDGGASRFDIDASFIPPDPVVPPDPIVPPTAARAFLGLVGGAAVEIAIGGASSAAPPLGMETVAGVDPIPF